MSTPKGDGSFNVYDDLKRKLMEKGVPEKEIAFIHDANTEAKKTELFGKVKSGQVRFLIGSTAKMGAGTNVQDRFADEMDELEIAGLDTMELSMMDEEERREAIEDAGLDPDDYDFD